MAPEASKFLPRPERWTDLTLSQVEGFLNAMARDVDFSKIDAPAVTSSKAHGGLPSPFTFEPMRRKEYLASSEQ